MKDSGLVSTCTRLVAQTSWRAAYIQKRPPPRVAHVPSCCPRRSFGDRLFGACASAALFPCTSRAGTWPWRGFVAVAVGALLALAGVMGLRG